MYKFISIVIFLIFLGIVANAQFSIFQASSPALNVLAFDCSAGFAASGTGGNCTVGIDSDATQNFWAGGASGNNVKPVLSGTAVNLNQLAATHNAMNLNYKTPLDVRSFDTTFTFVPDGWNNSFVLQNNTSQAAGRGLTFTSGAGCEGSFSQSFQGPAATPPNNLFAIMLDSWSSLSAGGTTFTYSSVQYYGGYNIYPPANAPSSPPGQSPCNPDLGTTFPPSISLTAQSWSSNVLTYTTTSAHSLAVGDPFIISGSSPSGYDGLFTAISGTTGSTIKATSLVNPGASSVLGSFLIYTYVGVNKISTSPVSLNAASPTRATTSDPPTSSGDTYSVHIVYNGSTLTLDMFDVTTSGTCSPVTSGTCFHQVWSGVDIPSIIGSTTAYYGLAGGVNNVNVADNLIKGWQVSVHH